MYYCKRKGLRTKNNNDDNNYNNDDNNNNNADMKV